MKIDPKVMHPLALALAMRGGRMQRRVPPVPRDGHGRILPGYSGNPYGAPPGGRSCATPFTSSGIEAAGELVALADDPVKPFVKKGKKNDAADAAALCMAASRPDVKFVPIKNPAQQGILALHSARSLLVKQQTMLANAMRSLATEFGLTVAKGIGKLEELTALVDADEAFPSKARQAFTELLHQCRALEQSIATFDAEIVAHARHDKTARRLATIPGIGPITASLIAVTVVDISVFKSARHFAAWLGLVPRQFSTGGKTRLGRITKSGNKEIRKLLVLGAT